MITPKRKEIVANFSGISNSSFKGYRVLVDLFVDELLIKAPDHDSGISYKYDSFSQLSIEHRQAEKQEDILDISINYPGRRKESESIIVQREDVEQILNRYRLFQEKLSGGQSRNDFEQVKEMKTVALVEFNSNHDVKNYNYGTLLLSNREINFLSYNGKNFILHLDQLNDSFYYQAVALPNDILGYSRWVSIVKISEKEKTSSEIVTFLTDELQAQFIEQLLNKHYEKYFNQKLSTIQDIWLQFNKRVDGYYSLLASDPEMMNLASGFVNDYGEQVLLNPDRYLHFDHLLKNLCYQSEIGVLMDGADEFEIFEEATDFFENTFLGFIKNLAAKYSFENPNIALFGVWKLIKHMAYEDYNRSFKEQYGKYFDKLESFQEYLTAYLNISEIDNASAHNMALLTYYLMKEYWKNEDNFDYYYRTLEQEIINNTNKQIIGEEDTSGEEQS